MHRAGRVCLRDCPPTQGGPFEVIVSQPDGKGDLRCATSLPSRVAPIQFQYVVSLSHLEKQALHEQMGHCHSPASCFRWCLYHSMPRLSLQGLVEESSTSTSSSMAAPSVQQSLAISWCLWMVLTAPVEAMGVSKRTPLEWPCRGKQRSSMMVGICHLWK